MPTIGKISTKPYGCGSCGAERRFSTNHWGTVYDLCTRCATLREWNCLESPPDGYDLPPRWEIAKLGDICDIIEPTGGRGREKPEAEEDDGRP